MIAVSEAAAKIQTLSEERAARVISLIEDLVELEARENAEDLAAASEALAEYHTTGESIPLDQLEKQLGL
jgi:hypothetical protein